MKTTHKQVAMSPEDLPRQRMFQLVDLPEPHAGFECLVGERLASLGPLESGGEDKFIVQAEWAWSPMHGRISNWEIGPDGSGDYWLLWCSGPTGEYEPAEWCNPGEEQAVEMEPVWDSTLVAACHRQALPDQEAAILLLFQAWHDERLGFMELDRPHFYGAVGLLAIDVIRSIEIRVWGERE